MWARLSVGKERPAWVGGAIATGRMILPAWLVFDLDQAI